MPHALEDTRSDGRRQRYEAKQSNERTAVPAPLVPTQQELRDYLGNELFSQIGFQGKGADLCDSQLMRDRYFAEGGLTLFLSEGFPNFHEP